MSNAFTAKKGAALFISQQIRPGALKLEKDSRNGSFYCQEVSSRHFSNVEKPARYIYVKLLGDRFILGGEWCPNLGPIPVVD
jgi:hypothetical protein